MADKLNAETMANLIMKKLSSERTVDGMLTGDDSFQIINFYASNFVACDWTVYCDGLQLLTDKGWLKKELTLANMCVLTDEGIKNL